MDTIKLLIDSSAIATMGPMAILVALERQVKVKRRFLSFCSFYYFSDQVWFHYDNILHVLNRVFGQHSSQRLVLLDNSKILESYNLD